MTDKELRVDALKAAVLVNSVCARPYDRVGDLVLNAQELFAFLKTGERLPQTETLKD